MAWRSAYLYEIGTSRLRTRQLQWLLRSLAASICHPTDDQVVLVDHNGESLRMSQHDFARLLEAEETVSFKIWFDPSHDLYVQARMIAPELHATEFGMEGTDPHHRAMLKSCLVRYFRRISDSDRAVGLVYDPEGVGEEHDWDTVFVGGAGESIDLTNQEMPELIMAGPACLPLFCRLPHRMQQGLLCTGSKFR